MKFIIACISALCLSASPSALADVVVDTPDVVTSPDVDPTTGTDGSGILPAGAEIIAVPDVASADPADPPIEDGIVIPPSPGGDTDVLVDVASEDVVVSDVSETDVVPVTPTAIVDGSDATDATDGSDGTDATDGSIVQAPAPVKATTPVPAPEPPFHMSIAACLAILVTAGFRALVRAVSKGVENPAVKPFLPLIATITGAVYMSIVGPGAVVTEAVLGAFAGAAGTGLYELVKGLTKPKPQAATEEVPPTV